MIEGGGWLRVGVALELFLVTVGAMRWLSLEREMRPREKRPAPPRPRGEPIFILVLLALAVLLGHHRGCARDSGPWEPSRAELQIVVTAPVLCWAVLKRVLRGPVDFEDPRVRNSAEWAVAIGVGFAIAYALGAWDWVSPDLLGSPGMWILVVGGILVAGGLISAERRVRVYRAVREARERRRP